MKPAPKDLTDPASIKDMSDADLYAIIKSGKGQMPGDGDRLKDTYVDRNLITGRHPGVVDEFMSSFLAELNQRTSR